MEYAKGFTPFIVLGDFDRIKELQNVKGRYFGSAQVFNLVIYLEHL